jgi:hypothetical protein
MVAQTKFAESCEKVRGAYHRRQFGLRTLLIAVALLAIMLAIGMDVYRNFQPRKEFVFAAQISIEAATSQSDVSAAKEFVTGLDRTTFSEWLLSDPEFLKIPAIQSKVDPKRWLVEHLRVRKLEPDDIQYPAGTWQDRKELNEKLERGSVDPASFGIFVDLRFVIDAKTISESDLTAIFNKSVQAIQQRAIDADLKAVVADRLFVTAEYPQ